MTLGEQQRKFLPLVAKLIEWAYANGYELTAGEMYRTPQQAALNAQSGAGISNSLHTQRLAVDLQLFINGVYQTDTPAYKPLGDYWASLHPDCCWGGNFRTRADGNHFSLTWGGVQ
jgi:hypothetical protein